MKKYLITLFLLAFVIPSIAFASWWNPFSWKVFNRQTVIKTENTSVLFSSTSTKEVLKEISSSPIEKVKDVQPQRVKEVSETLPVIGVQKTATPAIQNTALKIEQCKAVKEKTFNDATLKLNQVTNNRLQEIFNSLNEQYKQSIEKARSTEEMKFIYENQQIFWKNQKQEVETSKQKAIDQINSLLSEEYIKCLNK